MPEKLDYVDDMGRGYDNYARFNTHVFLPGWEHRRCQDGVFCFGLNLVLPKLGYKRVLPRLSIF